MIAIPKIKYLNSPITKSINNLFFYSILEKMQKRDIISFFWFHGAIDITSDFGIFLAI
jgi:hypothetical protein